MFQIGSEFGRCLPINCDHVLLATLLGSVLGLFFLAVIAGAAATAAYCGLNATSATDSFERSRNWKLCGTAAVVALSTLVAWNWFTRTAPPDSPPPPSQPTAPPAFAVKEGLEETWNFWLKLRQILCDTSPQPVAQDGTQQSIIAQLRNAAEWMQSVANQIDRLPTLGVNEHAIEVAAGHAEVCRQWQFLFDQFATQREQQVRLAQDSQSFDVLAESFLRGMMGDPFGKAIELQQLDQHHRQAIAGLQTELEEMGRRVNTVKDLSMRTRAVLSREYHREFPLLEN
jgi:hypothetical protein